MCVCAVHVCCNGVFCVCVCVYVFQTCKPKMTNLNAFILSSCNSVKQREKLVEILLTKDPGALLRVVEILKTQECGYEDLAKKFFTDLDKIQTNKNKQAASKSLYVCCV